MGNVEDQEYEANTMSAEPTQEEEPSVEEEEEEEESIESEDGCDMDQVPVGVETISCERNSKRVEGQVLVFTNPDTDLVPTNINELDSCDLDDETDPVYHPEDAHNQEQPSQEQDSSDSERESIDQDDLEGVTTHHKIQTGEQKLIFADVIAARQDASDEEDEENSNMNEKEYNEDEDADFNPVYCNQTLSDVEED